MDTTAPELSPPDGLKVEATGPDGATVDFTASATDLVDGDIEVDCTPASGTTFGLGETTVNCTATDASDTTATDSFTAPVEDTTAPELTLPEDQVVDATGPDGQPVIWETDATDLVGGEVAVTCVPDSVDVRPGHRDGGLRGQRRCRQYRPGFVQRDGAGHDGSRAVSA